PCDRSATNVNDPRRRGLERFYTLWAESCRTLCHSTQPSKANRRVVVRAYNHSASKVSFELDA
ncbi:hypothetical protein, partial [Pseudomonas orientalis]|uniref:hypothetical protein n=1 Tax=Pseudomonas orientalis TaxID=76758 RepID=UPI001A920448